MNENRTQTLELIQTKLNELQVTFKDNLYHFTCNVGGKLPREFRGHFDLDNPDNDYLLTDIEDVHAGGKSELKITPFSTDRYSLKLWNMTATHRSKIRTELITSVVLAEPTPQEIVAPQVNSAQQKQQAQQGTTPKTENEIREIVKKTLQRTISMPSLVGKGVKPTAFVPRVVFEKEYRIRFGREREGRADLAMLLNKIPFVIVECKRQGIVGKGKKQGIEQLESYLNATRARLGIFANDPAPQNWIYYDTNIGFDEIPRNTFYQLVRSELKTEQDIEAQAQQQKVQRIEKRASVLVTPKAVEERAKNLIETEAKKRVTENQIQGEVAQQQQSIITRQRQEIDSNDNSLIGCTLFWFVVAVILFYIVMGS